MNNKRVACRLYRHNHFIQKLHLCRRLSIQKNSFTFNCSNGYKGSNHICAPLPKSFIATVVMKSKKYRGAKEKPAIARFRLHVLRFSCPLRNRRCGRGLARVTDFMPHGSQERISTGELSKIATGKSRSHHLVFRPISWMKDQIYAVDGGRTFFQG